MAPTHTAIRSRLDRIAALLEKKWLLFVFLFAEIYLVITAFHGLRRFWYDELFTFYVCRLPGMSAIWTALKGGADLNPPLFYAVTRSFQGLFGDSELVTRLPAVFGFLVMSLCLFRFVSRFGSRVAGLAAMTFPLITGVYYYAAEARAYGMVLGFSGLAAICWQAAIRNERRNIALPGLAAALGGALLSHCYAVLVLVPFGLAELSRSISRRKIDWPVWTALAAPCPAVLVYLPLFAATRGNLFHNPVYQPNFAAIQLCYQKLFESALWPGLVALAILAAAGASAKASGGDSEKAQGSRAEIVLALGFTLVPVFGVILGMLLTGVFMDRYGVTSVIGFAILIGALTSRRAVQSQAAAAGVLLIFFGYFAIDSASLIAGVASKPAAAATTNLAPRQQFAVSDLAKEAPVVMTNGLLFLEYDHYEAKAVTDNLYFLTDQTEALRYTGTGAFDPGFYTLRKWFPIRSHLENYRQFLSTHPHFYVISEYDFPLDWVMRKMVDDKLSMVFKGQFPLQHGNVILTEVGRP